METEVTRSRSELSSIFVCAEKPYCQLRIFVVPRESCCFLWVLLHKKFFCDWIVTYVLIIPFFIIDHSREFFSCFFASHLYLYVQKRIDGWW